ncbi:hypothetical protein AB4Z48_25875 [Cupriavidus sp. 2TAF22]|uniref:hypothetical protein n=1 Tax=unclassified Cupriavidus TaxID=2640874 RepID=UPI003F93177E
MTQTPPASPAAPDYRILFAFSAAAGTVLEIKRLGLPAEAPRARKYQWLWLDGESQPMCVRPLRFVSMREDEGAALPHERVFAEGVLRFGAQAAELILAGEGTLRLLACEPQALSPAAAALVTQFAAPA